MNVQVILKELTTAVGVDTVREACQAFLTNGPQETVAPKKVKKERKPRGPSEWNKFVQQVRDEMNADRDGSAEQPKITYKEAFEEASRRRREGDPEKQAKYEAYRANVEAKAKAKGKEKGVATVPQEQDDEEEDVSRKDKICPMCDDPVPAPRGAMAGGDGSHRMCIANGLRGDVWSSVAEYYKACELEAQTRADNAAAEEKAKAAAVKKPRGRPPKQAST